MAVQPLDAQGASGGLPTAPPPDILARAAQYPPPQYNPHLTSYLPTHHGYTNPVMNHVATVQPAPAMHCNVPTTHTSSYTTEDSLQIPSQRMVPVFAQRPLAAIPQTGYHSAALHCAQHTIPQTTSVNQVIRPCRPPDYTMLAIVTCIFCNPCCGLAAVVFSILSTHDADLGKMQEASNKSKVSLVLSVIGIICGVITIACAVCFLVISNAMTTQV